MGVQIGQIQAADNRTTLNNTAHSVANFKDKSIFYYHTADRRPDFEILTQRTLFYAIEVATDNRLFNFNVYGQERNANNFFSSWWGSWPEGM